MNDIDKSVEAFDFALRRRFEWIDIKAKDVLKESLTEMLTTYNRTQINDLADKINAMNDVISGDSGAKFGLSEAYHIGHSYFKNVDTMGLEKVFNRNIVSILKEYTRGRDQESINDFIKECARSLGVKGGFIMDFKQIYEDNFKNKRYQYEEQKCNDVINEWYSFREKIANNTFTIDDYTNLISNGNYLTNFLEKTSRVFGKSSIGGDANRGMVKRNSDGNSYNIITIDRHEIKQVTRDEAIEYFNANIKPLYEMVVESKTIDDLKNIESSQLYKNYIAKQLVTKALVLESNIKDCDYKYLLLEMYDHGAVKFIYEELFELSGTSVELERNYLSSKHIFELLNINLTTLTRKEIFEVSKMLWYIYDNKHRYFGNMDAINDNPTQNSF